MVRRLIVRGLREGAEGCGGGGGRAEEVGMGRSGEEWGVEVEVEVEGVAEVVVVGEEVDGGGLEGEGAEGWKGRLRGGKVNGAKGVGNAKSNWRHAFAFRRRLAPIL